MSWQDSGSGDQSVGAEEGWEGGIYGPTHSLQVPWNEHAVRPRLDL